MGTVSLLLYGRGVGFGVAETQEGEGRCVHRRDGGEVALWRDGCAVALRREGGAAALWREGGAVVLRRDGALERAAGIWATGAGSIE